MSTRYFPVVSVLLFALSIIAFSDNLFTDVGQPSNSDPKFVIHGLFCFGWFALFVAQSMFIQRRSIAAHQRLGLWGMAVGAGVVVTTFYIFVVTYEGWDQLVFFAKANRLLMASFACLLAAGYRFRRDPAMHKRLMYMATLYMLEPILGRAAGTFGITPFVFTPLVWTLLFLSLFVYDRMTLKAIHRVTALGLAWFYVVWGIALAT